MPARTKRKRRSSKAKPRKKRRVGRKRKLLVKSRIVALGTQIPSKALVKFRTCFAEVSSTLATVSNIVYAFPVFNAFDPTGGSSANRGNGYDSWQALYNRYLVKEYKVTLRFVGEGLTEPCWIWIMFSRSGTSTIATTDGIEEVCGTMRLTKKLLSSNDNSRGKMIVMKRKFKPKGLAKTFLAADYPGDFQGQMGAAPSNDNIVCHIGMTNFDDSAFIVSKVWRAEVEIEQLCELTGRAHEAP